MHLYIIIEIICDWICPSDLSVMIARLKRKINSRSRHSRTDVRLRSKTGLAVSPTPCSTCLQANCSCTLRWICPLAPLWQCAPVLYRREKCRWSGGSPHLAGQRDSHILLVFKQSIHGTPRYRHSQTVIRPGQAACDRRWDVCVLHP